MELDLNEILRYLGYKNQYIEEKILKIIEGCIEEIDYLSQEKSIYSIFDISEKNNEGVGLEMSTLFLWGKDISMHLALSKKCAIMGATLGFQVDRQINIYSKMDLTRSVILDACATVAIESYCDRVQASINQETSRLGYFITNRFSPGYGDLPIEQQAEISRVLKLYETIGVSVTENFLMTPRKSVTAIIGLQNSPCNNQNHNCNSCDNKECLYRR